MKSKKQIRWAIVGSRDFIHAGFIRFTRAAVIKDVIAEHRSYTRNNGAGLTDAQFWRQIRKRRGYSVRRIAMTVLK